MTSRLIGVAVVIGFLVACAPQPAPPPGTWDQSQPLYENDAYLWWLLIANHQMYPSFFGPSQTQIYREYTVWHTMHPDVNLRARYQTQIMPRSPLFKAAPPSVAGGPPVYVPKSTFRSSPPSGSLSRPASPYRSSPPSRSYSAPSRPSYRSSPPSRGGRR